MKEKTQQELILESKSKRIVVLACPGSGKTSTITKKIIQLYNNGIKLKRILTVTFTRRAAKEMYERLADKIPIGRNEKKTISTLHSFGCKILYKYKDLVGFTDELSVALKSEKEEIAKQILGDFGQSQEIVQNFIMFVSNIKNGLNIENKDFTIDQFNLYSKKMIELNLVDLDDYIFLPVKILKENKTIREKISQKFDYIFVDEYQDINQIQNDFLDLLINDNTYTFLLETMTNQYMNSEDLILILY